MTRDSIIANAIRTAYQKGYRVTEAGDVVSPRGKLRKLTISTSSNGQYPRFNIADNRGKRVPVPVHRLALYQKYGEEAMSKEAESRHLDENSLNNQLSNLEIGTTTDNAMDQSPSARRRRAKHAATFTRRLTVAQAHELRELRKKGWGYADLQDRYGIGYSTISDIVNGRTYIDGPAS